MNKGNFEEINKAMIFQNQKLEAIKKILKEYNYDMILKDPTLVTDYVPKSLQGDFEKYIGKRTGQRYKYAMFTINFDKDVTFERALKAYKKYVKKIWIDEAMTCFEWRKEGIERCEFEGMHIHSKVWFKKGKNPYKAKGEIYNTFKNLVGNPMHINARYSNIENCFEDYIKGYRKGKVKDTNPVSILARETIGVENIYHKSKPL